MSSKEDELSREKIRKMFSWHNGLSRLVTFNDFLKMRV